VNGFLSLFRGPLTLLGGLLFAVLLVSLYLLYVVVLVSIVGFIIYFFLAIAGIFPPVDFIPFIPYI